MTSWGQRVFAVVIVLRVFKWDCPVWLAYVAPQVSSEERGQGGWRTDTEERVRKDGSRGGRGVAMSQGMPAAPTSWKRQGTDPLGRPPSWPCWCLCFNPLIPTANAPGLWESRFLLFLATRLWFLLQQPLETDTVWLSPRADPETRLWGQVFGKWYQESLQGSGKWWGEGKASKGGIRMWLCLWTIWALSCWGPFDWLCGSCFKIFPLCRKIHCPP